MIDAYADNPVDISVAYLGLDLYLAVLEVEGDRR